MELNIDNTYRGMEYKRRRQDADQLLPACVRIVEKLPPEDRAVLEKYRELSALANEAHAKHTYIMGYQHGVNSGSHR